MKKFLALFMTLAMIVILLSACGEKPGEDTTTSEPESSSDVAVNASEGSSESASSEANPSQTDNTGTDNASADDSTTPIETSQKDHAASENSTSTTGTIGSEIKVNGMTPPINGSVADIITFFNAAANATKSAQTIKLVKYDTLDISITKFLISNKTILNYVTEQISGLKKNRDKFTETFVNGKGTESTGRTALHFLPVQDQSYMSQLKPDYVAAATCVKKGDTWEVRISIKEESVNGLNSPPMHGSCMDTMDKLVNLDELPSQIKIEPEETTVTYLKPSKAQYGGVGEDYNLCVTINPNGKLNTYLYYEPMKLEGKVRVMGIKGDAAMEGYFKIDMEFKW